MKCINTRDFAAKATAILAGIATLALAGCQHQVAGPMATGPAANATNPMSADFAARAQLPYPGRKNFQQTNQMTTPSNMRQ